MTAYAVTIRIMSCALSQRDPFFIQTKYVTEILRKCNQVHCSCLLSWIIGWNRTSFQLKAHHLCNGIYIYTHVTLTLNWCMTLILDV